MPKLSNPVLNDRRLYFGYHVDSQWDSDKKERLLLNSIEWVDPDTDIAGMVDIVSNIMLWNYENRPHWMVSVSSSSGDSFGRTDRADISHIDIFNTESEAVALTRILESRMHESEQRIQDNFADNGWVPYTNNAMHRMADLSYLDGVFSKLDGVFLIEFGVDKVSKWALDE